MGVNALIQSGAILYGKERGLRNYDVVGPNIPNVAFSELGLGVQHGRHGVTVMARPPSLGYFVPHLVRLLRIH